MQTYLYSTLYSSFSVPVLSLFLSLSSLSTDTDTDSAHFKPSLLSRPYPFNYINLSIPFVNGKLRSVLILGLLGFFFGNLDFEFESF